MSFWVYSYYGNMTSYRFFKMAAAGAQYYFWFRICWCLCPCLQKVKIYQQTKFCQHQWSTYLWLRYKDFWFGKTNVHHIGILLSVPISTIFRNLHFILQQLAEFRPNRSSHYGNITSYRFIKMGPRMLNTISGFAFVDIAALRRSKSMSKPNFVDISIDGWDLTTSVFEKQTSATLEFYFWFRSRPVRRYLHVIVHHATEFRPNLSTHCGNMMSYPFLNMAAATAKYYFRFVFVDVTAFRRSKSISKPNFVQISPLAAEI